MGHTTCNKLSGIAGKTLLECHAAPTLALLKATTIAAGPARVAACAAASQGEACRSRGAAAAGRGRSPSAVAACPLGGQAGPREGGVRPAALPREGAWAAHRTAAAVAPTAGGLIPASALASGGLLGTSAQATLILSTHARNSVHKHKHASFWLTCQRQWVKHEIQS